MDVGVDRQFSVRTIHRPAFSGSPYDTLAWVTNSAYSGYAASLASTGIRLSETTVSEADLLFWANASTGLNVSILQHDRPIAEARIPLPLLEGGLTRIASQSATAGKVLTQTKRFVGNILEHTSIAHQHTMTAEGVTDVVAAHLAICMAPANSPRMRHPSILNPFWPRGKDRSAVPWHRLYTAIAEERVEAHQLVQVNKRRIGYLLTEKGKSGGVAWVLTEERPLPNIPQLALLSYWPACYYVDGTEPGKVIVDHTCSQQLPYNIGMYWTAEPFASTAFVHITRSRN